MRISLVQTDIIWENKTENLNRLHAKLQSLHDTTDIVVLPEMFSTGFSMHSHTLAEPIDGETIGTLKDWSETYKFAITGSFTCSDNGCYYNRAFFITPTGKDYYYDKRHLFRMGEEPLHFSAGDRRLLFNYEGWNICLNVCYDLRFPVWLRNFNNEYDLLIIVASWPATRRKVWETLLCARAIENQSYVCGVNRIGTDGNGILHSGQSMLLDAKGECLTNFKDNEEAIQTTAISMKPLQIFRSKFPVWKDADILL